MNTEKPGTAVSTAGNPFASSKIAAAHASAAMEAAAQREVAEVQGAMLIARRFPRDEKLAMDRILQACTRKSLAEEATFQYARGGTDIAAPSIRLAEVLAQNWGNLQCGVKELGRREGYSDVMTYAVDLETGFRDEKTFQVRHWRDTKQGGYQITDERDIYELVANMGARRKRACILTVIPGDVVDTALGQIETTLKAKVTIDESTVKGVIESFEPFGVTREMIEKRIQRRLSVETLSPALYLQLRRIYQSIKDNMSGPADWFEMPTAAEAMGGAADDNTVAGRARAAAAAAAAGTAAKDEAAKKVKAEEEAKTKAAAEAKAKAEAEEKTRQDAEAQLQADAKKGDKKGAKKAAPKPADPADPAPAATAAAAAGASTELPPADGSKPAGTPEAKEKLLAKMRECKDTDTLATVADEANLFSWPQVDLKQINNQYLARLEELEG